MRVTEQERGEGGRKRGKRKTLNSRSYSVETPLSEMHSQRSKQLCVLPSTCACVYTYSRRRCHDSTDLLSPPLCATSARERAHGWKRESAVVSVHRARWFHLLRGRAVLGALEGMLVA